jgi:SM-20-related protein
VIDIDRITRTTLADSPWQWAEVAPSFVHSTDRLVESFPSTGFTFGSRSGDDKAYAMSARPAVVGDRSLDPVGLSPAWQAFLGQVTGADYRAAVQALTGVDLSRALLDVTFWRYDPGCWLSPHPDKEDKLVSHVFYMNDEWDERWGGWLGILHSNADDSPVRRVAPRAGTSVVIVRSPHSWHMVAPVEGVSTVRRSVQVVFRRPESDGTVINHLGTEAAHA